MKRIIFILAIAFGFSNPLSAQITDSLDVDLDTIPYKYPYLGSHVPPWFGIIGGYEGFRTDCWHAGIVFNLGEIYSEIGRGDLAGIILNYKRSFSGQLNTFEAELGIYTTLAFGFGFNQNFSDGSRTFGFRPFLGTSLWHFQVLAGYNFYSKNQEIEELYHFTLQLRYTLPLFEIFKEEIDLVENKY